MSRNAALRERAELAIQAQERALELRVAGRLAWTADDPGCPDVLRLAALMEELGEVARALHDGNREELDRELSQVAGVALAWGCALQQLSVLDLQP